MASTAKKPRLDNTGIWIGPTLVLKVRENRKEEVLELSNEGLENFTSSELKVEDLVDKIFFQDNTMFFNEILPLRGLILLIFPPGSGKTTMAALLHDFLSKNAQWSEKLCSFFADCEFMKNCKESCDKYKQSSPSTIYITFENVRGRSLRRLEQSLCDTMIKCFTKHSTKDGLAAEKALLSESREFVYGSLRRLLTSIRGRSEVVYVLLDCCDTVYNQIIQLDNADRVRVCRDFTSFITSAVPDEKSNVLLLCFGASPYFGWELAKKAKRIFSIAGGSQCNKYFSYSKNTIDKVIKEWKLETETSYEECLKVAGLKFEEEVFINPSICASFLRSLHSKTKCFLVNAVPRSLWFDCIFTVEDRDLLIDVLRNSCRRKFSMSITMMNMIQRATSRKVFYPLFIYGGFIACEEGEDDTYVLQVANETSRCILEEVLNTIFIKTHGCGVKEVSQIYEMIFDGNWSKLCESLSALLSPTSTRTFGTEEDYNNWLFGILHSSELKKTYSTENQIIIKNNVSLAGLHPDITVRGDGKLGAVWELKYLKAKSLRKKVTKNLTLKQCFDGEANDDHKETVLKDVKAEIKPAIAQVLQYASSFLTAEKCDAVMCFVIIFYLNHVVLLVSEQFYRHKNDQTPTPSKWTAFSSPEFFTQEDLDKLIETG